MGLHHRHHAEGIEILCGPMVHHRLEITTPEETSTTMRIIILHHRLHLVEIIEVGHHLRHHRNGLGMNLVIIIRKMRIILSAASMIATRADQKNIHQIEELIPVVDHPELQLQLLSSF
jgi:hypothetical protein